MAAQAVVDSNVLTFRAGSKAKEQEDERLQLRASAYAPKFSLFFPR